MGWLRLVGSLELLVSFDKEPYKRDDILQQRSIILRSLLIVATPYLSPVVSFADSEHCFSTPVKKIRRGWFCPAGLHITYIMKTKETKTKCFTARTNGIMH